MQRTVSLIGVIAIHIVSPWGKLVIDRGRKNEKEEEAGRELNISMLSFSFQGQCG